MNVAALVGRLTKEPVLERTKTGKGVCSFTLAVNRAVKSMGQPDADFIRCQAWGKTAENLCAYMHKGSRIGVTGPIQTGSYESNHGKVYTTTVVANHVDFLEPKKSGQQSYTRNTYIPSGSYQEPAYDHGIESGYYPDSEDLPF